MFFMRTDKVVVFAREGEMGRIGRLGLAPMRPSNFYLPLRRGFATLGWHALCPRRNGDGLSNSLRLFIEQQGKWQTINLRGHES
jgi:hypothetical protein